MLIVIAIIAVLAGVSFIAVQQHQRSLNQLDRDAVAKEIFIAAQNHLSMAKSEKYHGVTDFGTPGDAKTDAGNNDVYYFYSGNRPAVYDQILPFGAIDGTVLSNSFIIRYQPEAAVVLDVFYWTTNSSNSRFDCNELGAGDYATLVGDDSGDKHKNYKGTGLLGWFGGQDVVKSGEPLNAPDIEVFNGDQLYVTIKDNNPLTTVTDVHLKLIITGASSEAKAAIECTATSGNRISKDVNGKYKIVLDDITTENMHFTHINTDTDFQRPSDGKVFIPGENITVQAVSYSNSELTSVAYSGEWTTNSLFADISQKEPSTMFADTTAEIMQDQDYTVVMPDKNDPWITAKISNIRHLENLDARISYLDNNDISNKINITNAMQVSDLDWKNGFLQYFGGTATLFDAGGSAVKQNCFIPVKPSHKTDGSEPVSVPLNYEGKSIEASVTGDTTVCKMINHKISNIEVDNSTGNMTLSSGGLFESVNGGSIKDLELVDIKIKMSSGNAGALAGTLEGTRIENVIAYNSTAATTANITTEVSGSAGGLIGSAKNCTIEKSAAALIVSATGGNAGGLIGTAEGGTISACYSGGHTMEKKNGTGDKAEVIGVIYDPDNFNVTGSAYAGGLIGEAGAATISNSYSTCSAKGKNVGGLVGKASGTITNSYCTGLVGVIVGSDGKPVSGTSAGAFAAECTGTTTGCSYFGIVNEFEDETLGYDYLTALPKVGTGDGSKEGVTALDADANEYNTFTSVWSDAVPYLKTTLMSYYGEGTGTARVPKYNLKSVEQLAGTLKADDNDTTEYFVATHYGDWPAPEIFVVNTAS